MPSYSYPTTDYDRARNLLALIGSFWAEVYHAKDQVQSMLSAKGQIENQTIVDLLEVLDSFAYRTCPVFHTDNWYVLHMYESELNNDELTVATFDGTLNYNEGARLGVGNPRSDFTFPLDEKIVECNQIFNRFTEPSLSLTHGVDFIIRPGKISFRFNPFTDNRVATRPVYENGEVVDQEAVLWLFKSQHDFDYLYRRYGYVLGLKLQSSKNYRKLLTAFFDALVGGTTANQVITAAAAITGIPVVLEQEETVEVITDDADGLLIVTDQHSYKFSANANAIVEIGDTVRAGTSLVDALEIIEFNRGIVPEDLRALSMGRGFLANCYYGDLIFENKEVPLEVDENHESGFTYVTFGLGGFPLDVDEFFDTMHARGIAVSQLPVDDCDPGDIVLIPGDECDGEGTPDATIRRGTLAHLLDVRENPVGEPTAASLPDSINPLEFLIQNVLRANAAVLKIRGSSLGSDGLGLHISPLLSKIVPPHTAVILLIELTPPEDSLEVEMIDETMSTFKAMGLSDDLQDLVAEKLNVSVVSGTCQ